MDSENMNVRDEDKTVPIGEYERRSSQSIGDYTLIEKIGEGGMATVYKAYYKKLDVVRAIKILSPRYAQDEKFSRRFEREARIAAKLQHPNIVAVYDIDEEDGQHYIGMEYIEGRSLNEIRNREKKISLPIALLIAAEVCKALDHAHKRRFTYGGEDHTGIVHRDIKPDNIMVTNDGDVKLTDFGIARAIEVTEETIAGTLIGTIPYMSPEQLEGKQVDHRTDIYSLGVVLYEVLTREKPFKGESPITIIREIAAGRYKRPSKLDPNIPKEVEAIIDKAMATKPENRYQDIKDMYRDIQMVLKGTLEGDPKAEINRYIKNPDNYRFDPEKFFKTRKKSDKEKVIKRVVATLGVAAIFFILIGAIWSYLAKGESSSIIISSNIPGIEVTLTGKDFSRRGVDNKQYLILSEIPKGRYRIEIKLAKLGRIEPIMKSIDVDEAQELIEVEFPIEIVGE